MTAKEALDRIAILSEILVDVSKSHIMPNEAINEIRNLDIAEIYFLLRDNITELEELKHDVKRYFHDNDLEGDEYNMLWSKLMKAGNGK